MIDGDELNSIEIRDLAELLGNADFVIAVARDHGLAGDLHVFVMIHGEIMAVTRTGAEGSYAKHVGQEMNPAPVQVKIMGQEPERRCASLSVRLFGGLMNFVLDEPVGPGDANGLGFGGITHAEDDGLTEVSALLVMAAGFDFDLRGVGELDILNALKCGAKIFVAGFGGVAEEEERAVALDGGQVVAAIGIEIERSELGGIVERRGFGLGEFAEAFVFAENGAGNGDVLRDRDFPDRRALRLRRVPPRQRLFRMIRGG